METSFMKKSKLSLAIAAIVATSALPITAHGGAMEDLSEQVDALSAQLKAVQAELRSLKEQQSGTATVPPAAEETEYGELVEEVVLLREDVDDLDERLMQPERHAAVDRLEWGGDFRFQAHSIESTIPTHVNGLQMQGDIIAMMQSPQFGSMLGENFTFEELSQAMQVLQGMPPSVSGPLMQQLQDANRVEGYDFDDDLVRTSRLRLEMNANVADDVIFYARLAMYKV
jgi:hypothetical protein